ncbi:MAG TPA: NAD(P)/FAD-dependent oxidoreductase [Gammaproteobacteria bacterium]
MPEAQPFDVVVIGGGAAGLMCAIECGKRHRRTIVLEHANRIGKKILLSGGGRCNFTNINATPANYLSRNPHFAKSALARYTPVDFIALVEKHNIAYHEKKLGQLFCDESAKQIVQMLADECRTNGVQILTHCATDNISRMAQREESDPLFKNVQDRDASRGERDPLLQRASACEASRGESNPLCKRGSDREAGRGDFLLQTERGSFRCKSLVIASGGLSFPTMGASDFGYRIARQFAIDVLPTRAALVPLTLAGDELEMANAISGITIDSIARAGKTQFRENLLFTHRGLSGPAILQASSYWNEDEAVRINLLPDIDAGEWLASVKRNRGRTKLKTVLAEKLPNRFVDEIESRWFENRILAECRDAKLDALGTRLNDWHVRPHGSEGYKTAEVTLGGVNTNALSSKTLEAKNTPGLFFIGEVVDVTGWLGGYNFQWAWASGWSAGQVA